MSLFRRFKHASRASLIHLGSSLLVALITAVVVFLIWYPSPYHELSGGRSLFLILVSVDVVCGPLLTLVLFNPSKPRRELITDMSLIVLIQLMALGFGIYSAYQARPLFLVHEVDRFRVIGQPDYLGDDVNAGLSSLDESIRPRWYRGPVTVGVRDPRDAKERKDVLVESIAGGRDYSQRPEFYVRYDSVYAPKVLARAQNLADFIARYPALKDPALQMLSKQGLSVGDALFLPVLHRQEWVAVMDKSANILGFLPGDGFSLR